jgi:hypothetical protein
VTTVSLHDPQTLYRHWEEQQWSPDRGDDTDRDAPGASANEIRAFALDGLNRRLKIIGVELA